MELTRLLELAGIVLEGKKLQPGTKVKVGHESKTLPDGYDPGFPDRYKGRTGVIVKYVDQYSGEPPLYAVQMPQRKRPLHLYTDEFEIIK